MNKILAGLQIIAIHDPNFLMDARENQIAITFNNPISILTEEDFLQLKKFGWYYTSGQWTFDL